MSRYFIGLKISDMSMIINSLKSLKLYTLNGEEGEKIGKTLAHIEGEMKRCEIWAKPGRKVCIKCREQDKDGQVTRKVMWDDSSKTNYTVFWDCDECHGFVMAREATRKEIEDEGYEYEVENG